MVSKEMISLIIVSLFLIACSTNDSTVQNQDNNSGEQVIPENPDVGAVHFCGISTEHVCEDDSDCMISGCSGHVCQGKSEEPTITICIYKDCYNADNYNLTCGCNLGACEWMPKG